MSLDLRDRPLGSASPQNDSGHYSNISGSGSASSATSPGSADSTGNTGEGISVLPIEVNGLSSCENDKLVGVHDEEENYEGFGFGSGFGSGFGFGSGIEADVDVDGEDGRDDGDSPGGTNSAPSPTGTNPFGRNPRSPNSSIGRHSWLRTSLRRTPPSSGRKRLGCNALASQLYRSGSFNSLGRGSNCDTTDDMYSDVSLEEDVIDLNHKPMCDTKRSCESSSRPYQAVRQSERVRLPPYAYYPQPYHRYIPYDPYGIHHPPIPTYSSPYYNNNEKLNEVVIEAKGWSWYSCIIVIIIIFAIGYGLYRFRKMNQRGDRQPNPLAAMQFTDYNTPGLKIKRTLLGATQYPAILIHRDLFKKFLQTVRKRRDVIQNCPAEFLRCAGMIAEIRNECTMPCENCKKYPIFATSSKRNEGKTLGDSSNDIESGIIDIPRSKISVATGISSLNTNKTD